MNQNIISTEEAKKASLAELLQKQRSTEKGLSDSESKERLQKYGYNEITEKKVHPFVKFLSYCWGPIPWMIEVAGALLAKFLTGNIIDEKVVFRIDISCFSFLVRMHKVQA